MYNVEHHRSLRLVFNIVKMLVNRRGLFCLHCRDSTSRGACPQKGRMPSPSALWACVSVPRRAPARAQPRISGLVVAAEIAHGSGGRRRGRWRCIGRIFSTSALGLRTRTRRPDYPQSWTSDCTESGSKELRDKMAWVRTGHLCEHLDVRNDIGKRRPLARLRGPAIFPSWSSGVHVHCSSK